MTIGELKQFLSIISENKDSEEVSFKYKDKEIYIDKFTLDVNGKLQVELSKKNNYKKI